MKRILSVLFVLLMCLTVSAPAFAEEEIPPVIDMPDLLTYEEWEELCERLETIRNQYDCDVAIILDEEFYSSTAEASADDLYDDLEYGVGVSDDGILFYISTVEREYHFSTHGYGRTAFNDDAIEYLKREVEPHLKNEDYYRAMKVFADLSDELLSMARNGAPYEETDWGYVAIVIGCAVGIPLILAFIMMKIQLSKMNTAVTNDYAQNYIKPGSYHLDMARDIFLYSHVTRVKKETSSNSSSHTSSSGRTHGGGGGSF